MKLSIVMLSCAAIGYLPLSATAQPAQPALQLKPVVWQPKAVHRSQLRPILKPGTPDLEVGDVYVPPAQTNAMPAQAAAGTPIKLAAAHHNVPPDANASPNPMPPATMMDFMGRYLGAGIEVALSPSPNEPPRRMSQVEISGNAAEFTVKWATMRIGANFKAETVKSTQQEITFRPGMVSGRYVAVAPSAGESAPDATAEVKDRTMIVIVSTPIQSGGQSVQRYERTLTSRGMDVVFTRTDAGKLVRQVNLTLTRSGDSLWRNL